MKKLYNNERKEMKLKKKQMTNEAKDICGIKDQRRGNGYGKNGKSYERSKNDETVQGK